MLVSWLAFFSKCATIRATDRTFGSFKTSSKYYTRTYTSVPTGIHNCTFKFENKFTVHALHEHTTVPTNLKIWKELLDTFSIFWKINLNCSLFVGTSPLTLIQTTCWPFCFLGSECFTGKEASFQTPSLCFYHPSYNIIW